MRKLKSFILGFGLLSVGFTSLGDDKCTECQKYPAIKDCEGMCLWCWQKSPSSMCPKCQKRHRVYPRRPLCEACRSLLLCENCRRKPIAKLHRRCHGIPHNLCLTCHNALCFSCLSESDPKKRCKVCEGRLEQIRHSDTFP